MKQSSLNDSHAESRAEILADCIANVCLNEAPDLRSLASLRDEPFSSRGAYDLLHHSNMPNPDVMLIWSTKLPTKVKFFAWLLCHGRLNTRDIFTAAPSGLSRSLTANVALLLLSLTSTSSSTVPWHKALGVRLVLLQIQPLYDSLGYSVLVLISLSRCMSTSSRFSFGISGRHVMR